MFLDPLELLVFGEFDRAVVSRALQLAGRIFHVSLHQCLDGLADGHQRPGALGVVVHEDVVALLRILPQVEHLGHDGDILLAALPAEVRVDGETAGRGPVVAAQVEHGLVVAGAGGAQRQLVLGELAQLAQNGHVE